VPLAAGDAVRHSEIIALQQAMDYARQALLAWSSDG